MWNIKKFVSKGDYYYAVVPEHPNCNKNKYVLAHRIIMENHLGRILDTNEVVHHKNGDKKDNNIFNLELMTVNEHCSHHANEKGQTMCEIKCPQCEKIFSLPRNQTHVVKKKNKFTSCSPTCRGKLSRYIQLNGITSQVESAISENILREYNSLDNTEGTRLQETP